MNHIRAMSIQTLARFVATKGSWKCFTRLDVCNFQYCQFLPNWISVLENPMHFDDITIEMYWWININRQNVWMLSRKVEQRRETIHDKNTGSMLRQSIWFGKSRKVKAKKVLNSWVGSSSSIENVSDVVAIFKSVHSWIFLFTWPMVLKRFHQRKRSTSFCYMKGMSQIWKLSPISELSSTKFSIDDK